MTGPRRIQLSRKKGWRMPANTLKVDRKTRWGNLYQVGLNSCGCRTPGECSHNLFRCETAAEAVEAHRVQTKGTLERRPAALADLRGKNLACWCRLCARHSDGKPFGQACADCAPCHSDTLGELANDIKCEAA